MSVVLVAIGGVAGGLSRWLGEDSVWVLYLFGIGVVVVLLYDRRKR